jgi:Fe-S cluster biogenesis protein NfuA
MTAGLRMHAERTPNPHSLKWVLGQRLVEGAQSAHFAEKPPADVSPLAARLFEVDGVESVFLASNFVTVTKRPEAEWADLAQAIVDALRACVEQGGEALGPAFTPADASSENEVVARIQRILEQEVRPAVAMDGGDIVFAGFRDGIVELYLHGSCSGCPSSSVTLKQGIETRLMEAVPEVQGVRAL